MRKKAFFTLLFTLFLIPFARIHAVDSMNAPNDILVSISPDTPAERQQVTISVQSYTVDLHAATIEWTVDGKPAAAGIGSDRFVITTKDVGAPTQVKITITSIGSLPVVKNVTITPMSVDLLWQATDSIVPPLYRGKAMPTNESTVKFVAIPQVKSAAGNFLASTNFLYNWSDEYNPSQIDSGYDKDSYETTMSYFDAVKNVQVDATTPDGGVETKSDVSVTPVSTKIVWYASSPLYGPLYNAAITGVYTVPGSDTSIIAEPYFFSPGNIAAKVLSYEWELNGAAIDTPHVPNTLFLHRDGETTGTATLDIHLTNTGTLFQDASNSLTLVLQ